jgi:hypothetical protein
MWREVPLRPPSGTPSRAADQHLGLLSRRAVLNDELVRLPVLWLQVTPVRAVRHVYAGQNYAARALTAHGELG